MKNPLPKKIKKKKGTCGYTTEDVTIAHSCTAWQLRAPYISSHPHVQFLDVFLSSSLSLSLPRSRHRLSPLPILEGAPAFLSTFLPLTHPVKSSTRKCHEKLSRSRAALECTPRFRTSVTCISWTCESSERLWNWHLLFPPCPSPLSLLFFSSFPQTNTCSSKHVLACVGWWDEVSSRMVAEGFKGILQVHTDKMHYLTMLLITTIAILFAPVVANPFFEAAQGNSFFIIIFYAEL